MSVSIDAQISPQPLPLKRIVLHWRRLGPYHLARLRGAHELFSARGVMVTALEIAGMDRTYGWKKEEQPTVFERRTLFPNRYYEDLRDAELKTAIFAALDELSPDAVAINGYGFRDSRICLDWCNSRRTKAILMTETTVADKPRFWIREVAKRLLLRRFHAAICGGQRHVDYVVALGMPRDRVFTGYDAVDNEYFRRTAGEIRDQRSVAHVPHLRDYGAPGRSEARLPDATALPGLNDPRPFFLTSNRFIARKNLRTLLQAYARYRSNAPNGWRLVLLGSGEQEAELRKLVADLVIPDVTFAGFRQIEELPSYYAAAGCFIHPALIEPWGLVVNEAMASELPVIVSNGCGCVPELVHDEANGYTFDPANERELSEKMAKMSALSEAERQHFATESRKIVCNFGPERFALALRGAVESSQAPVQGNFRSLARLLARALLH